MWNALKNVIGWKVSDDRNSSSDVDVDADSDQYFDALEDIRVISSPAEHDGDSGSHRNPDFDVQVAFLYLQFNTREEFYKNDSRTKLLQKFISIFVEQKFDDFTDKFFKRREDINKRSIARIKVLEATLKKFRRLNVAPSSQCSSFKRTHWTQLDQRQLMFCAATTFLSSYSENTNMDPTNFDFEAMGINNLNVPALLDIIGNCRLFGSVREYVGMIVDGYVQTVLRKEESQACTKQINTAIKDFLVQIDDRLLPEKSDYLDQINLYVGTSQQDNVTEQDETSVESQCFDTNEVRNDTNEATATQISPTKSVTLYQRVSVSAGYDSDEDTVSDFQMALLYSRFHGCEEYYRYEPRTKLLQEFVSIFVGRMFEQFIDDFFSKHKIHTISKEGIKELDAKLKEKRLSHFTPNSHWINWFEYTDCTILERRQLVFCAAVSFMSSNSENTPMDPMYSDFKTLNINNVNVPALLDIINNCTLFCSVHKYVGMIVKAYLDNELNKEHLHMYMNQIKEAMQALVDNIDDTLLPDKACYQEQVNAYKTIAVPSMQQSKMDDARFKSIQQLLKNPLYINWVKGTLTLKYLCNGARPFIIWIFTKFKLDLPDEGSHFDDGNELVKLCQKVEWKSQKWILPRNNCPECEQLFKKVIQYHRTTKQYEGFRIYKNIPVGGAWGIAKMYMPGKCRSMEKPDDADALALFQIIRNCYLFAQSIPHIDEIIKARNELMHSTELTLTDGLLKGLYESELEFLEEALASEELDDAVKDKLEDSREKITEIKYLHMDIETIQKYAKDAMQYHEEEVAKANDQIHSDASVEQLNAVRFNLECFKEGMASAQFERIIEELRCKERMASAQYERIKEELRCKERMAAQFEEIKEKLEEQISSLQQQLMQVMSSHCPACPNRIDQAGLQRTCINM